MKISWKFQLNLFLKYATMCGGKRGYAIDMKVDNYCIDLFQIAWLGCGGFQKNSNSEFSQSLY